MAKQPDKSPPLTEGQRAYETRRAAKAGVSLDKWLAEKERRAKAEDLAAAKAAEAEKAQDTAKKNWFGRMLDKAHKPLG